MKNNPQKFGWGGGQYKTVFPQLSREKHQRHGTSCLQLPGRRQCCHRPRFTRRLWVAVRGPNRDPMDELGAPHGPDKMRKSSTSSSARDICGLRHFGCSGLGIRPLRGTGPTKKTTSFLDCLLRALVALSRFKPGPGRPQAKKRASNRTARGFLMTWGWWRFCQLPRQVGREIGACLGQFLKENTLQCGVSQTHAHTHTHPHTHTPTHPHTHTRTHARTHTRTRARTHTHTHTPHRCKVCLNVFDLSGHLNAIDGVQDMLLFAPLAICVSLLCFVGRSLVL